MQKMWDKLTVGSKEEMKRFGNVLETIQNDIFLLKKQAEEQSKTAKEALVLAEKKTSDYEADAKAAAHGALSSNGKIKAVLKRVSEKESDFKKNVDEMRLQRDESINIYQKMVSVKNSADLSIQEIEEVKEKIHVFNRDIKQIAIESRNHLNEIEQACRVVDEHAQDISETVEESNRLRNKINETREQASNILVKIEEYDHSYEEVISKSKSVHGRLILSSEQMNREIRELVGYTEEVAVLDENGDETDELEEKIIPGKKHEIEDIFKEVKRDIEDQKNGFQEFVEEKEGEQSETLLTWDKTFIALKAEIERLLPSAMTAGLSFAYAESRGKQEKAQAKKERAFLFSIIALAVFAFLPFGIEAYEFYHGASLGQALEKTPNLVLALVPVYIPLLWIAITNDKAAKLAKRLKEEYAHKESLTKTYEGLNREVGKMCSENSTLAQRLLYNMITVSAENPGRLMGDYEKSDHPFVELVDQSSKLADVIDRFAGIPGAKPITEFLNKKQQKMGDKVVEKVTEGLDSLNDLSNTACLTDEEVKSEKNVA